ncbi:phospholipase D-like domain-containing protein [Cognatishimia sp. MH4019]|uniref:phospholipase D-like domain-containing protein n=1 Tax=Cognatishimia sp. MH4019 TaxID=2854030 RepID=UPI001CD54173|nr:phospholipase D-like domain-containing protein [Cognatishimia sp. MH4019]
MTHAQPLRSCQILLTAQEAFTAFETAVLEAETDVLAGFRIFDFSTKLRSDAARAIGEDWFDLVRHKLDQGIRFDLTVSDFEPVVRWKLHGTAWRAVRRGAALREVTRHPDLIRVRAEMHGARVGSFANFAIWPKTRSLLKEIAAHYNGLAKPDQARFRTEHPALDGPLRFQDGAAQVPFWPSTQLMPATHHHKIAVIDSKHVYVGGLDLNERRYDTPDHDRDGDQTWHDVQMLVGDADLAQSAKRHLDSFTKVTRGKKAAQALPRPFLQTVSAPKTNAPFTMSALPKIQTLRKAHLENIAQASDLIYLETQYFRDREVADALCTAAARRSSLGLVLILPAAPEDVAFEGSRSLDARYGEYRQASCVMQVADAFKERAFIGAPVKPERAAGTDRDVLHQAPLVYLHAKVSIFDDRAAIVSSANLNGRSLSWDTEAGVELTVYDTVRHLKERCVRHWLRDADPDPFLGGIDAVQNWRRLGDTNAARAPEDRRGFLVPYNVAPARRFGKNLPGVPEEMV